MTLHDQVNAMLHDAHGRRKVNRVMGDVCWMMIENNDSEAIASVLAYLGESDAVRILTEE
jgi:hypothetical protein